MQGLFKHIKGPGEPECTDEDFDDTLDLENPTIRRTEEGQQGFELALADRLFDHRIEQEQEQEQEQQV